MDLRAGRTVNSQNLKSPADPSLRPGVDSQAPGERLLRSGGPRLRVVVIAGADHPDFDMALIDILSQRCDVFVCAPASLDAEALGRLGCAGVKQWPWPRHRHVAKNLLLLWQLRAAIRQFDPDVVHVLSEGQIWLNLLPILIAPIPMVVTMHDVLPHPGDRDTARVPRAAVNAFVKQAKAVIVHGESLRRQAISVLGLPSEDVFIGTHPITDRYFRLAAAEGFRKPNDGLFRILFFGRIYAYKGLAHLIEAEPLIGEDVIPRRVTIAGRGDDMASYIEAMADPSRFDMRPRRIPDLEAARLFAEADVLVLPYVEASQSGVLLIAAAFALPVVASNVGEIGALVAKTQMGLLVPPGDAKELADAITRLARSPQVQATVAANARAAADGILGPCAIWAQTEAVYLTVRRAQR